MDIKRRFVDGPFGQIHIRDNGSQLTVSPPLICLHQSPKSSREFAKILPALGRSRRVIAIDNPGHGESDIPATIKDATIENYARSAWAVLDKLGVSQIDLLGHHTGVKVAVEMAFQHPKRVRRIIGISALILSQEEVDGFRTQFKPIPLDETGSRFTSLWEKSIKYRGPGVSLEDLALSYIENFRSGEAYEWGHIAAFEYAAKFAERVSQLPHPIYVINPNDMLYELTPRVMPLLKNGTLIDKPDWGYGFMDTITEDTVALLNDILG